MNLRKTLILTACASVIALGACSQSQNYPLFPAERTAPKSEHFDAGRAFSEGLGVPRDYAKARRAFARASDAGDARAINSLGVMELQGRGGSPSPMAARGLFQKAADAGSASAHYNLGLMHELRIGGFGVLGNGSAVVSAAHEYRIAAAQGHALAQRRLALLLEGGRGIPADPQESQRLHSLSAVNGDPDALARLTSLDAPAKLTPEAAAALFAEDACAGCGQAEKKMASRAVTDLSRLSASGDASARYNLAVRHLTGNGAVKDQSEAARLFTLAARSGYAPAARQLAQMHLRGEGVGRSKVLAHAWLNLASRDTGMEGRSALSEMEALEGAMSSSEIEQAQGLAAEFAARGR